MSFCFPLALFAQGTPTVSALSCTIASFTGSGTDACTVTLNAPAPASGLPVTLTSFNKAVTVPVTVTVPANATSVGFTAIVSPVASTVGVTLAATAAGVSKTFNLVLHALVPTLSINATSMAFGNVVVNTALTKSVTFTSMGNAPVTVNSATLTGTGFTMSAAALPATLNPGQTLKLALQFDPITAGAATGQLAIASNSSTGSSAVISLSGTGVPTVSALSCTSASITGSGTDACTVTLTGAAPVSGLVVTLTSFNTAVTVPATVTVPANATSVGFTATVSSVGSTVGVTLAATAAGVSKTFNLVLHAVAPMLSINRATVAFGNVVVNTAVTQSVTLTSTGNQPLTVNSATLTGTGFMLSAATFPVTLNPFQALTLTVQFDPITAGVAAGQLTIASNSSTSNSAVVSLSGTGLPVLSALSCSNASMTGSGTDACTVSLSGVAPSGGMVVSLSSNNTAVTLPASVTVPANAASVGFTATVSSVGTAQSVTVTAGVNGVSTSFALQLNAAVPTLGIDSASVAFGNVELNTSATQSVTLTSSGTAPVTVNSATLTGTGFTLSAATLPAMLSQGQILTLAVQFDPATAGAAAGQLTISSNSSTGSSAVISLSGTGTSPEVELSWTAPSSPDDPVAGYSIYRAPSGSSSFQLLNSSEDTQTTYVDSTVQGGQAYDYAVTSVDASAVESVASNLTTVTIP